ncbi:autotransporter family protein [Bordetella genomosp. 9]|uniref:autotransporter family protein n=1 Tax=Bordetella genomosp. 9 TaxID=1416803 RepID=UPI0012FB796B|nr:autotransporter outer membrane beta-barrel domain-containing protein [Bordetella genomosp. 9]
MLTALVGTWFALPAHALITAGAGENIQVGGPIVTTGQALRAEDGGVINGDATLAVQVSSTAMYAHGAIALNGGAINLTGGAVATDGPMAFAMDAVAGTLNATGTTITTLGNNSHGAYLSSGSTGAFSNVVVDTSGRYSNGIDISSGSTAAIASSGITIRGLESYGVVAQGAGSTATMTQGSIMQLGERGVVYGAGAGAIAGGSLALIGTTVTTSNNVDAGQVSDPGSTLRLDGAALTTQGDNGRGVHASSGGVATLSAASVKTSGANAFALYSEGSGGGVSSAIKGDALVSTAGAGASALAVSNGGAIDLTGSTVTAAAADAHGVYAFGGTGAPNAVTLTGSELHAGGDLVRADGAALSVTLNAMNDTSSGSGLVLNALNGANVNLIVDATALTGDIKADSGSTASVVLNRGSVLTGSIDPVSLSIDGTSTWNVTANSSLTSLSNAGTIAFQAPTSAGYKTITTNNYVGSGGTIAIHTFLGADASPTDKLIIDGGAATGATTLRVMPTGGGGAATTGDGIQVVAAINNATTAPTAFALGNRVAAGAYEYTLQRGGSSNAESWYLRSTYQAPSVPPEVPSTPPTEPPGGTPSTPPADPPGGTPSTPPAEPPGGAPSVPPADPPGGAPSVPPADPPGGTPSVPPATSAQPAELPNLRPEVAVDMAVPALASRLGLAMLGTYCDRYADARDSSGAASLNSACMPFAADTDAGRGKAVWARGFYENGSTGSRNGSAQQRWSSFRDDGPSYDYDLSGVQVGGDLYRLQRDDGSREVAGLYLGAAHIDGKVDAVYSGSAGKTSMDGYALGAYWTHHGASGWYADTVLQGVRFESIRARSSLGQTLKSQGWGVTGSAEGGRAFQLGSGWSAEPQAQLIYQWISIDGGKDDYGQVDFRSVSSVFGRVGARLVKSAHTSSGRPVNAWLRANLWHGFGSDAKTVFRAPDGSNGVALESRLGGSWTQVGLGVSAQVARNVSVFGSGDYSFSVDSGRGHAVQGLLGVKVVW